MKLTIYYFDKTTTHILVERTDEAGQKSLGISSPYNFVSRDEIIARVINVPTEAEASREVDPGYTYYTVAGYSTLRAGEGIYFDEISSTYRASEYGFVIYDPTTTKIELLSPLQIAKDKLMAFYIIFPTKFGKLPTSNEVEESVLRQRIFSSVDKSVIETELANIDPAKRQLSRIIIARGKEPVNGYSEYFMPLITMAKKAGKVLDDGRIDYREVESIIEIKKGQELLKKIPAVKPEDGYNIFGERAVAIVEERRGYIKGDNIVPLESDSDVFVSSVDGCLVIEGKKISVSPIAIIRGNIDYDSGNIDFSGSVKIFGSVMPGFSVKAKGDIIVEKNVDDALLEAGGNIIVKVGIIGKGAGRIIAGGAVKAGFIMNTTVEAVGQIIVEDSIIGSVVFSNDKISVTAKHGKIIGGRTTARHEIVVNEAGTAHENITSLGVGKSLFVEREIVGIRKDMTHWRGRVDEVILKMRTSFGEGVFENPKKFLSILPDIKKKNCLLLMKELSECNHELKQLVEKKKEAELKLKLERDPVIIVTDRVLPGTVIMIKKNKKLIEKALKNVKFYEDPEQKVISFTAAV